MKTALLLIIEKSENLHTVQEAAVCLKALAMGKETAQMRYNIVATEALREPEKFTPEERLQIARLINGGSSPKRVGKFGHFFRFLGACRSGF